MVRKQPSGAKTVSGKPTSKSDDPAQSKRFIDAAREAEADETEEGADRAFRAATQPGRWVKTGIKIVKDAKRPAKPAKK